MKESKADLSPFVTMKESKADLRWLVVTGLSIAGGAVAANVWAIKILIEGMEKGQAAELKELKAEIKAEMNAELKELKAEIKAEMKEQKAEMKELERKMNERFDTMEVLLKTLVEKKR